MSDAQEAPQVNTPDGVGTPLQWPANSSKHFRVLRGNGEIVDHVGVTPVLLESGEVRFYAEDALSSVIRRSGALK